MARARKSVSKRPPFGGVKIKDAVSDLVATIRALYLEDAVPWVVGYSGGKDSTAVLQLVWMALQALDPSQRQKPVHVISTDTLVENPIVAAWVARSLEQMKKRAEGAGLPILPHRLVPKLNDRFWVNLIGRGYPSPRVKFRWCTERLKIKPSNDFIRNVVRESGETILVLGSRRAESAARARDFARKETGRVRDRLLPNAKLHNSLIFTPIEDWSNDDVWLFLMQFDNPWGYRNKDLLTMYQGASEDSECPLVVDDTTPSCGDSRFGCWVCTMVEQDRSMQAMIRNDDEKEWMLPLLQLRNELDEQDDRSKRDFRRMSGAVQIHRDREVPGPYTQETRQYWLHRVLECQRQVRELDLDATRDLELISFEELEEIRRIWVVEKHELEDNLPSIYETVTEQAYPGESIDDTQVLGAEALDILRQICGEDALHFELVRDLLDVERTHRTMARRVGLFEELERCFKRSGYFSREDAVEQARRVQAAKLAVSEGRLKEAHDQATEI